MIKIHVTKSNSLIYDRDLQISFTELDTITEDIEIQLSNSSYEGFKELMSILSVEIGVLIEIVEE